jgi:D-serine deaminase-like pyridoxal phosphate-dependent protein
MVDHPDNVADLGAYFASRGVRLNVMIEYGVVGGRCGCRSEQEVSRWPRRSTRNRRWP